MRITTTLLYTASIAAAATLAGPAIAQGTAEAAEAAPTPRLPDGTVEAVFEGEQDKVEAALEWCRQGPPNSRVGDVKVDWQDYTGEFSDFRVTY